ncbi:MAG: hypothetical protein R3F56_07635 [Planctomycetota bacterium]
MSRADFRVRLRGRNFWLADGEVVGRFAFDVAVFVCASDPEEAAVHAMQALADDDDLRDALRNTADDPPLVFTVETTRLDPKLAPPPKRSALELRPDDGREPEPGLPEEPRALA